MMTQKIWLFLALSFQLFIVSLWSAEKTLPNEIKSKAEQLDSLYPTLEEILNEDLPTSLSIYHQLIEKNEAKQCYDEIYVEALYRVPYFLVDHKRALEALKKIEIYDKNLPKMNIENGYLITDKIPPYMGEEEKLWFKKVLVASGLCKSEDDIEFANGQIKVKLKQCCCKPQNLD